MQDNKETASLRAELEGLPTQRLDQMLLEELEREKPSGEQVRLILRVLREREADMPCERTPGIQAAWEKYRRNAGQIDAQWRKRSRRRVWLVRLGSLAAVAALVVLAVPARAEAESLFEKLCRLTDSVVDFFSPDRENENLLEYTFVSEHPGLRQVQEELTALGVTVPVVPTWLPEGYELVECKTHVTSQKAGIAANFRNADSDLLFKIDFYGENVSHEYHRDEASFDTYEVFNIAHTILRNNDRWVVLWFPENLECFLTLDCSEDALYEILDSIYVTGGTNEKTD